MATETKAKECSECEGDGTICLCCSSAITSCECGPDAEPCLCDVCDGTGKAKDKCEKCDGEGWLSGGDYVDGSEQTSRQCPWCEGSGLLPAA